jgi:hypothetical protein
MRQCQHHNRAQYADLRGNIKENAFILGKYAIIGRKLCTKNKCCLKNSQIGSKNHANSAPIMCCYGCGYGQPDRRWQAFARAVMVAKSPAASKSPGATQNLLSKQLIRRCRLAFRLFQPCGQ